VFRIVDYKDSNNQLHNGYEIVVVADLRSVASGLYKATLLNEDEVEIEVPTAPSSFLENYARISAALSALGHISTPCEQSHTIQRSGLLNDPKRKTMKFLLRFHKTGEALTNGVFTPMSVPTGEIDAEPTPFSCTYPLFGKDWTTTEVWLSWKVARVEHEKRMVTVSAPVANNSSVADALATKMSGMSTAP
jgi:hypothetical protein